MVSIARWLRLIYWGAEVAFGYLVFVTTGKTPIRAHQRMIGLYCLTGGYSNDFLSRVVGWLRRPYHFSDARGALGNMGDEKSRAPIVAALRDRGYYVFENKLPDDICDRLLRFAMSHSCTMRRMDGAVSESVRTKYHRDKPQAVRYDFDTQDLLENGDVQCLLADLSFPALAQDYLGSAPTLDVLGMWWHTAFSDRPDSDAAQYFHFDMDRPRWLKFFIYLTNVETSNGPHSFVAGSQKTGRMPARLLQKGYARLSDEEVGSEFDRRDIVEFTGPRGTILVEDTRGLHKGKHVQKGDRLILQLQFSNSLFGGIYPKATIGENACKALLDRVAQFPKVYASYR